MKIIKDKEGNIINFGDWDYCISEETGEITNPLPEGAYEEDFTKKEFEKKLKYNQNLVEITNKLKKLDEKRIRAICEPSIKDEKTGETWLDYYNSQVQELRSVLTDL